jgi:hypothetical protein
MQDTKRRKRNRATEPEQLYQFRGSTAEVQLLLERDDLTEEDIRCFCSGKASRPFQETYKRTVRHQATDAYRSGRLKLQDLVQKFQQGQARIDDDLRIIPIPQDPWQPPAIDLPPVPPPPREHDPPAIDLPPVPPPPREHANNLNRAAAPLQPAQMLPEDEQEQYQQWLQQQEVAAAASIARAIQRYRDQGVSLDDLVLLRQRPAELSAAAAISFTFRRICIAVLSVVLAFVWIMLQTMPFPKTNETHDPSLDKLMGELLHIKHLIPHATLCGAELSRDNNSPWYHTFLKRLGASLTDAVDCSDGVLHIPSQQAIVDAFIKSKSVQDIAVMEQFVTNGVQASWFLRCQAPPNVPKSMRRFCDATSVGAEDQPPSCFRGVPSRSCFRGVHDNFLTEREYQDILALGALLIARGGDHFDVYADGERLRKQLPSVLENIQSLLANRYCVTEDVEPVAFRINAVGPMDGTAVPRFGPSNNLVRLLNRTNYLTWINKAQIRNDVAQYSLPWPFRINPKRDTCHLLADMQVDPSFSIQTTIFLSDGAGDDFRGGVALYVDNHPSNINPRKKIQRGVTIDGSRGRLVVSTGGLENRRCRLPTRAGIRASMQIWWSYRI